MDNKQEIYKHSQWFECEREDGKFEKYCFAKCISNDASYCKVVMVPNHYWIIKDGTVTNDWILAVLMNNGSDHAPKWIPTRAIKPIDRWLKNKMDDIPAPPSCMPPPPLPPPMPLPWDVLTDRPTPSVVQWKESAPDPAQLPTMSFIERR